jgi:prophage regulatory protein
MSATEILRRDRARKRIKRGQRAERRAGKNILRMPAVIEKTGLGKSSIYNDPTFPKPVPLGPRAAGWLESEIDSWIESRIKARDSKSVERSLPLRKRAETKR